MTVMLGPTFNRRVTCDANPANDRSESQIAVNPLNPDNLVASSKRFTNPMTYAFSLACYASFDAGQTWTEAPPLGLQAGWGGLSDPALAWDDAGNCYLVALPIDAAANITFGIAIYQSTDGGRTWGAPNLIHTSSGDDKQWAVADTNPASAHYGNVYAGWDDGSTLRFARTTDNGVSWKGIGAGSSTQSPGSALAEDSVYPGMAVAADGSLYIFWTPGDQVKFVKSTDGGNTFSAPAIAATGITNLGAAAPHTDGWTHLPGGTFRVITNCNATCGTANNVMVAWADYREGVSRIYYRRSTTGGSTWQGSASGQPLLTGATASAANQHDFHPQLASMPAGEIGCAFYSFGPKGGGEFPSNLIDTVIALSTNSGQTFADRQTVTEAPWDPTVDAPWSHGDSMVTFIGDYFGLCASRLGFFPAWTDTRTGVQEIFSARVTFKPADLYIRDSSGDNGDVPSPGNHWEYPDLIVRRQPDGATHFANQDLLRDGHTDHYIYARVHNRGPNRAENVQLAVVVGNYPSLDGLPGAEFNYPHDWYQGDWSSPAELARHLALHPSPATTVNPGQTKIIGPVVWHAADIPDQHAWHPCLLAEARADNDANHGGPNGSAIDSSSNPCQFGAYFWGSNNAAQRNLSYATTKAMSSSFVNFPFIVGSRSADAGLIDVIVDKGPNLRSTEMQLQWEAIPDDKQHDDPDGDHSEHDHDRPVDLELVDGGRVILRLADGEEVGRLDAPAGLIWHPACRSSNGDHQHGASQAGHSAPGTDVGGVASAVAVLNAPARVDPDQGASPLQAPGIRITAARGKVSLPSEASQLWRMTLSFNTPEHLRPGSTHLIRIYQRRGHTVTGGVFLQLDVQ